MIVRVFRAVARAGMDSQLQAEITENSTALVDGRPGLITYYAGRRVSAGTAPDEQVMITIWEDRDAVEAFAGADWDRSVISDTMAPLLEDHSLTHYEVLATPAT